MDGTWNPRAEEEKPTALEKFLQEVRGGSDYVLLKHGGFDDYTPEEFDTVISALETNGRSIQRLATWLPPENADLDRYFRTILGSLPALKKLVVWYSAGREYAASLLLREALKICRLEKLELRFICFHSQVPRKVMERIGSGVGASNSIEKFALDLTSAASVFDVGECIVGFATGLFRSGNTNFRRLILKCGGPLVNRTIHLSVHGLFRCCKYLAGVAGKQHTENSIVDILGTISRQTELLHPLETSISTKDELNTMYTIIRRLPDLSAWSGFDLLNVPPLRPEPAPAAAAAAAGGRLGGSAGDGDYPPHKRRRIRLSDGGSGEKRKYSATAPSSHLAREVASVKRENQALKRRNDALQRERDAARQMCNDLRRQLDVARQQQQQQQQQKKASTANPITPDPPRRSTRKRRRKEDKE